jgi:hypothetical protein
MIAEMIAIAFINFHTLKTQKWELALGELDALLVKLSDNDWVTDGKAFIEAQRQRVKAGRYLGGGTEEQLQATTWAKKVCH